MTHTAIPLVLLSSLLLIASACGDSHGIDPIDVSGATPEQAADDVADAFCSWQAKCGTVTVECSGPVDGEPTCTGEIQETDFQACFDELRADVLEDLRCRELSADETRTVNACINKMITNACVTRAELDAYLEALEAGEDDAEELIEVPAECEAVEAIFEGCGE